MTINLVFEMHYDPKIQPQILHANSEIETRFLTTKSCLPLKNGRKNKQVTTSQPDLSKDSSYLGEIYPLHMMSARLQAPDQSRPVSQSSLHHLHISI